MAIKVDYGDWRGIKVYKKIEDMVLENLINRDLEFKSLVSNYVAYLQILETNLKKQMCEADYPLVDYIEKGKLTDKNKYIKDCAVRYLVKYERFKTAPIGNKLEQYVKDNNINLDGEFMKDLYLESDDDNED